MEFKLSFNTRTLMSTSTSNMLSLQEISGNKKRLFLLGCIMTLVLVSWTGILDHFSYNYLDGSFVNASALYILTRSINGVVSMLQTTTVGIGVASISVGELLDPINDIVERFSDLIVIAIGSIVTQKILLTIISSLFFKVLLTISGLVLIASIYIKEAPFIHVLSRGFIFLVFLRLSLSLMVLLSYTVDKYYLDEQIQYNKVQVGGLHDDLIKVQKDTSKIEDRNTLLESDIQALTSAKRDLNRELESHKDELEKLQEKIIDNEDAIRQVESGLNLVDRYNVFREDEGLDARNESLSELKIIAREKESQIEQFQEKMNDIDKEITYKNNIITGESNGIINGMSDSISGIASFFKNTNVSTIKAKLDQKVDNILDLLILITIQTLILPILFMYLLVKAFKLIWDIKLSEFIKGGILFER